MTAPDTPVPDAEITGYRYQRKQNYSVFPNIPHSAFDGSQLYLPLSLIFSSSMGAPGIRLVVGLQRLSVVPDSVSAWYQSVGLYTSDFRDFR